MRMLSLQTRLVGLVVAVVAVIWVGALAATWVDTRRELGALLDAHLAQAAALLVAQQAHEIDDDALAAAPDLHPYAPRVAFQVWHEGQLVLHSANAPAQPMSVLERGFETSFIDGVRWRIFSSRGAARDVQVYVGERTDARDAILAAVSRNALLPLALALPLLFLAGGWAVRAGLGPLRRLSAALQSRGAHALEPVRIDPLPVEMVPLVDALNALLARIGEMLEAERRFTADAAHELRTPIAAIRAQAQVALGAAASERDGALRATIAGCDRASHLVEQLLQLARLEEPSAPLVPLDLVCLVRHWIADLAPRAIAREQELSLDAPPSRIVLGDEALFGVLVRNLVDNAIRYAGTGARIDVQIPGDGPVALLVEDSGPGLSPDQLRRVGERFYRVSGTGEPGSGLGLSIVRRIARVHGMELEIGRSERLGGTLVKVCRTRDPALPSDR